MTFERQIKIRFQHCDPAGIVFYPRYFEMLNQVVEDWFDEALGMSFQSMHVEQRIGVPLVHVETDFFRASRIGETVPFRLALARIGQRSFDLEMEAGLPDDLRLRAKLTLACVSLGEPLQATPVPERLRQAMRPYLLEPSASAEVRP